MIFLEGYVIWFIAGVIIMLFEFEFPGFIIFFFGVGAWITGFGIAFGILESLDAKMLTWIISSVLLLFVLRKYVKNIFLGFTSKTDSGEKQTDDFIGKTVEIAEKTGPDFQIGKVKFQGSFWKAKSKEVKNVGEKATIVGKENITLTIT
jgi:inner membrane protein